ncbi:hypothetical protein TraAM80_01481 [Trypanosoma rangeli]|uniref:Leucine-rich repeat protein (LRRP) n=1 Tax=Trypanosoma rangeli TaxID=5698 RepID=A0A422NYL4_TRYRA|nr:uncharacterized protein TraAM80_01481 [Trypanosoma rangeli]RNF10556.1 hypothetical protein TraAM80_01481 [Trypanosoma rangeli]|eukprot:RNF10556.1 hypothetical protein TraAM80_01481 [Trypanosoma rangeli]
MLFEPSGVLRSDYGAYCHALGVTEREELYQSIFTDEERRHEEGAKYLAAHPYRNALVNLDTTDPSLFAVQPLTSTNPPSATTRAAVSLGRSTSVGSVRTKKKGSTRDNAGMPSPAAAPPTLTFISMRHLKFCLNERDVRPLALAIPYCVSLVSVEFVGCGLSEESYFMLVKAIYTSRRVASVTIDFNGTFNSGFYTDPTITSPSSLRTSTRVESAALVYPAHDLSLSQPLADSMTGSLHRSCMLGSGGPVTGTRSSQLLKKWIGADAPTFLPTEYRGFKGLLLSLEQQAREEKGRKGKIDSKRQTQLQQQQDTLAQIDKENPVLVPRGWAAMLLTGIKHLSLRGNGITNDDAATMASLLLCHPRSELVSLNLWGNCIGDDGAVALAQMLKENRTLQALDLGHNDIGDVGLLSLVDCFRMQEMPFEKLQMYRKRYLLRRDATMQERQLATTPPPTYPSYQEVYTAWYQTKYPAVGEEKKESKKGTQAKAKKTEPVLSRPTSPFDRDCFRMEHTVRVPGNTVLRCVNLGNNRKVTLDGAREALRVLSLREPAEESEMSTLQSCAVQPPELYCAAITLRTFVILHSGDPGLRAVQRDLSDMLYWRLLLLPRAPLETEEPGDEVKKKSSRNKK